MVLSLSTLFPSVLVFPKHFFTVRITRSNSSKVNKFNKQQRVIQVTAAERTRGRDEAAHIMHLSKRELYRAWHLRDCTQYPQPHTKFQALYIGKHI